MTNATIRPGRWGSAEHFAALVESSEDAIISKTLDGVIQSWNPGAQRLFGYTAEEAIGRPVLILIPPERWDEEPRIIERLRRGERINHYETIRIHKDGAPVHISLTISPIRDAEGRIVGASKIARDISDVVKARERQNLLLREMSHRIKNLFALAGGVVSLSARLARTPEEMARAVRARLEALSRAHDLTLSASAEEGLREPVPGGVGLEALIRTILQPYNTERSGPEIIAISGPDVAIGAGAVASLALLLHEFATNAVKYGALSVEQGRVDIVWRTENGRLRLIWRERGGPPVTEPKEDEGFGTTLSRATVTGQFGGRIERDWRPDGLVIELTLSLESLLG